MNGYNELKEIHKLAHDAVVEFDKGEYPSRTLIARIREIAGTYPKYGSDNEHIGYVRYLKRGDNPDQVYLSICDSDAPGAFKIYRRSNRE